MSNESHYTPRLDPSTTVPMTIDHCTHLDDSQLVGVAVNPADSTPATVGGVVDVEVKVSAVAAEVDGAGQSGGGVVKRKRGRPPRAVAAGFVPKKEDEEEDVCFICFDGGSLVLCDRKGCPKAYHPACIKRDEAFFRSKAKWNCGWHICNSCQRASHYMCYTCPYSSCKGCTKDADYVCVRGNKGFCGICMRTIMLIENNSQGSQETVQVDFDDKSSWEYLFKVYWLYLKEKLSLTIDEITQATNPLKGNNNMAQNMEYSGKPRNVLDDSAVSNSKRRKINKQFLNQEMAVCMEKLDGDKGTPFLEGNERQHGSLYPGAAMNMENFGADGRTKLPDGAKWASKELLELVAHMKNGDTSMLSQFDVQALLLEYIKRNSLRDPHRKCEIICDSRLLNLFGKARVGDIEMLKLLEYHFLIKDNSKADDILKGGRLEVSATLMDADISNSNQVIKGSFKTRNSCKKAEDPGQHNNSRELAATDVYNISLIYLRRNSMENLLENIEKFHDFVVGSFVRIRISDTDQKEEFYRLVQVVGTSKSDEQYTVGSRTVNIMLVVLNLEKRERISIDGISNQDFSEEECKRLRQSMEFGLIRRLTVGEIQEKAMTLHTMRVNEWLEAETLRLINLRDRASEKGQRKQLRECVEKIELLSSPEERQRRLQEIPEVHVDPSLSCHQKVGEDIQTLDKRKQGKPVRQRNTDSNRKRRASVGLQKVGGGVQNPVDPARAIISHLSKQLAGTSELPLSVSHLPQSVGIDQSGGNSEIDRIWHYQDPSGRTQGPFTMLQLRKWSMSGHFPLDLRIWRINENQDRSILLTDALRGHYDKVPLSHNNSHSLSQNVRATSNKENSSKEDTVAVFNNTFRKDSRPVDGVEHLSPSDTGSDSNDNRVSVKSGGAEHDVKATSNDGSQNLLLSSEGFDYNDQRDLVKCNKGASRDVIVDLNNGGNCDGELEDGVEAIQNDSECLERNQYPMQNDNNSERSPNKLVKSNEEDNQSCLNASENVVKSCEQQRGTQLQGLNPPRDDITPFQPQVCSLLPNLSENHSHTDYLGESSRGEVSTHNENNANERFFIIAEPQTISGHSSDKQCNSEGYSSQSSGQYWRPPNIISPSEVWDSNSVIPSVDNSVENSELTGEANISDLPNPVPKPSSGGLNGQCTEEKLPSAGTPVHNIGASWSSASNIDSVPQISEVACEWSGYSSTSAKPSAQNKDSCFLSASPLRLELAGHHAATSNSGSKQPRHLSPSNPAANLSTWQEIVSDPNEFLVDSEESVSDLLAEVEAMESLNAGNGPGTPTSMVNFGEDLTEDSRDDWFSPIGSFGPTPDTGKGEAIGTTGYLQLFPQSTEASTASDLQLPSQSTVTNDLCLSSQPDILDLQKKIGEHSTQGAELDVDAARRDVSVNQLEPDCGISHPQSMTDWGISNTETSWRAGAVGSGMRWGPEQTNAKMISMVSEQRTGTMGYGFYQGQSQERFHMNMSWGPTPANATNPVTLWNPARCSGDRSGPREANFQGGDPGYMRDKPSWHRQAFGNGGNSYRHSPKGQRVCKFYEKGYCKKGTSCSFLHP